MSSFDPFSQTFWEGSNTSSLSLAPLKVQKNENEFPASFPSKSFLSNDSIGNLLSKDLPVSLLLQQISSGVLSPDDLDPNTREMVLIYCKEITEGRQQRRNQNKAGQDAVVPRNNLRREGLVPNVPPNVNHLTNPLTNTLLSETSSGVWRRGVFDNGSLLPTKSEMEESAFQSFGNAHQVLQSKSGGAFLNSQVATEKNTGFFPGLQSYGLSSPTANKQAGESSLYPFHIGTDSSQVIPSNPGTTCLNTDLTGQRTGLSVGTMFQSSLIPHTDSEAGESAFSSFNAGISGPQYKPSSLGGPFLASEASTGNLFTPGSFNSTKLEVGESAFRAFNNGGSSTQFLSLNSGGDFLGLQGSGRNTGISTEPMFHVGPMASENRQNEEKKSLPFNLEENVSQVLQMNLGAFLSKHGPPGFQDGEIPTVPEISSLPVSGQAISHAPSFPDPVPINPGALARQQRASADSKRFKRRKPPVEAMVVPGNGNSFDVNPSLALFCPPEKIAAPPVGKAKEERRNKRLLRNRVSAQQARERKRHQMMEMEDYCSEIELKNAEFEERLVFLREENEQLRQIVRDNMRARSQNRSENSDNSVSQLQNEFHMDVMNPVLSHNGGDGLKNSSLPSSSMPTFGNGGKSVELESRSEELKRLASFGGESGDSFQVGSSLRGNNGNGEHY